MGVEDVFTLFSTHGKKEYVCQGVTQSSHMIQTAMQAEKDGQPPEVILGCLLHDIGNLVGKVKDVEHVIVDGKDIGPKHHDTLGADYLKENGFPLEIYCFASHHAQAIRYLAFKDPDFAKKLVWASQKTLERKGGPMNAKEAAEFEKLPHFDAIVKCRQWDEKARDPHARLEPIEKYKKMAVDYLAKK